MQIQRNIQQKLAKWKSDPNRKPLVLQGARQVGKTPPNTPLRVQARYWA